MASSTDLHRATEAARAALAAHPRRDLELGRRQAVWAALGPRDAVGGLGHRRRARLALDTAREVLVIWERVFSDRRPHAVIEVAERFLEGKVAAEAAWRVYAEEWKFLDALVYHHQEQVVVSMVGYAALAALSAAVEDEAFDPSAIDPGQQDREVDPHSLDAGFCAAGALAGGPSWDPVGDDAARERFWHWWIERATIVATSRSTTPGN